MITVNGISPRGTQNYIARKRHTYVIREVCAIKPYIQGAKLWLPNTEHILTFPIDPTTALQRPRGILYTLSDFTLQDLKIEKFQFCPIHCTRIIRSKIMTIQKIGGKSLIFTLEKCCGMCVFVVQ